ncbi:hypothetical protein HBI67_034290 [Parastagonospora nodorum]|nr:hypothetical protein HBI67_034290 [Parastagonospora nodorum]KAH6092178.1 hypothetical protein HBI66_004350 [Parastagonospora nodorum]
MSAINAIGASLAVLAKSLHVNDVSSLPTSARTVSLGLLVVQDDQTLLTCKDYRNSQASVQPAQKEGTMHETVGAQMRNNSDNSDTTLLFRSDLGTAARSLNYTVQPDQTYKNHSSRPSEETTGMQSELQVQTSEQPPNSTDASERIATTSLNCDILSPLPHALDGVFLDLNFPSQEGLYIDLELQHSNSVSSNSDGRCHCCLSLMQSLNRRRQEDYTDRDPLRTIQSLNGAAEQFLMCDVGHGKLWYLILLALYQDADDNLRLPEEIQEMAGTHSRRDSHSGTKSSLNGTVCINYFVQT